MGRLRIELVLLAASIVGTVALWIPVGVWLLSPDRTTLLGNGGRYLAYWTIALQLVVFAVGLILVLSAPVWEERRARRTSLILGAIAWAAMPIWGYWVAFSLRPLPVERGVQDWAVFATALLVTLAPVVIPPTHARLRSAVGLALAGVVLAISGVLVLTQPLPHLIAPTTVYVVFIVASGAVAVEAREVSGGRRGR